MRITYPLDLALALSTLGTAYTQIDAITSIYIDPAERWDVAINALHCTCFTEHLALELLARLHVSTAAGWLPEVLEKEA